MLLLQDGQHFVLGHRAVLSAVQDAFNPDGQNLEAIAAHNAQHHGLGQVLGHGHVTDGWINILGLLGKVTSVAAVGEGICEEVPSLLRMQ